MMGPKKNYLLGKGELLTNRVKKKSGGGQKNPPYDVQTAKKRVSDRINKTLHDFEALPDEACPNDKVVAALTMHPRYISKSDFPDELLSASGLKAIGGKAAYVKPEEWGVKNHPDGAVSDIWFVSTTRHSMRNWSENLLQWTKPETVLSQLQSVEDFFAPDATSKIKKIVISGEEAVYEAILHSDASPEIIDSFYNYVDWVGANPIKDRVRFSGGVIFVPIKANDELVEKLADFSFLRAIRRMPELRTFRPPVLRSDHVRIPQLPEPTVLDLDTRVAIFDGGLPESSPVRPWVNYIEPSGIGPALPEALEHGEAVTSAFLFGHLTPSSEVGIPHTFVDHVRVIDDKTGNAGDFEMYDVLDRILSHLDSAEKRYRYVNLSLGPDIPVEDDEITVWTSEIDQRAASGKMLVTVSAGNSGESDQAAGLNRIQPPSDGVNILAVGACNSQEDSWERCSYSSIGPGRTPGIAKPDGVAFGGSFDRPFGVINTLLGSGLNGTMGTSFSAPFALRTGAGIQALIGSELSPLAIRALLVHNADPKLHPAEEVGWGRFKSEPLEQIVCSDDEFTVVYQGELPLKEYLRVPIPIPKDCGLAGMVIIKATLVIAPEVDPAFAHAYTRAGLDVVFRPNTDKVATGKAKDYADTDMFFSEKNLYKSAEYQLRGDGHKWEPCWKAARNKRGSSLIKPCFDIYYHNRDAGRPDHEARPLPYTFIVTVKAKKEKDLYRQTVNSYSEILMPIEPIVDITIKV